MSNRPILLSVDDDPSVSRAVETMTMVAVAIAGLFPILHLGLKQGFEVVQMRVVAVRGFFGASILLLLSVAFSGNAVRSLQEADVVAATPVHAGWARPPVFVSELTGIHPTREGLITQAVLLAIFASGAAWVFGVAPARRRRRERMVGETERVAA